MKSYPQFVEEVAAEAFWSFVNKNDFAQTGFAEKISDIPPNLWSPAVLAEMLKDETYVSELFEILFHAVAETIVDHNRRGKNIIGSV